MLRVRLTVEQKDWLDKKAEAKNLELDGTVGKTVYPATVVRALIQLQIDYEKGLLEVLDDD